MDFDLNEVIIISEYVRVGSKSTPKVRTIDLINEYLEIKRKDKLQRCLDWWKNLSERDKWNLTINHLSHWVDLSEVEIMELYELK